MISQGCQPISLGMAWSGISRTPPELLAQALSDPEDDSPAFRIRPMSDPPSRDTIASPSETFDAREAETHPRASDGPILPPAPVPDEAELRASAVGSSEMPEWFESSFLGKALARFAADAEDIRKGRDRQHADLLAKLDEQGAKQDDAARLVVEMGANLDLLTGEFKLFRDACEKRLAEGDERFRAIERKLVMLESKFLASLEQRVHEALKPFVDDLEEIRGLIAELKNDPAQAPSAPT